MKKLFFSAVVCTLLLSCSKEQVTKEPQQQIDKITVVDKKGNLVSEYLYDVKNQMYIGEEPAEKGNTIKGTLWDVRPNSSGGHTYYCVKSDEVCYSNQ